MEQSSSASPVSSRSRHWGMVTDAGMVARRPMNDLELRESHNVNSYGSHVGGGVAATRNTVGSANFDDVNVGRRRIRGPSRSRSSQRR